MHKNWESDSSKKSVKKIFHQHIGSKNLAKINSQKFLQKFQKNPNNFERIFKKFFHPFPDVSDWNVTLLVPHIDPEQLADDYYGAALENLLVKQGNGVLPTEKRSCVRRGGPCDGRPNDCCFNSACRCNLWGTNCKCQRMGLFQKWG